MESKEWTTIDRAALRWPSGPWDGEPDKAQWQDEATGLPCLAVRHSRSGHWCGYVGVTEGHPFHGKHYDNCSLPESDDRDSTYIDVHGGLTFSNSCQPGETEATGVCHTPAPGEPDHVWWLGFDCAHSGDHGPQDAVYEIERPESYWQRDGEYRDLSYVKSECRKLAAQIKSVSA